jgi:hypothetical protein
LPAASIVMSLQKPLTVAPRIGVVVGAGKSQLPLSDAGREIELLHRDGPLPLALAVARVG